VTGDRHAGIRGSRGLQRPRPPDSVRSECLERGRADARFHARNEQRASGAARQLLGVVDQLGSRPWGLIRADRPELLDGDIQIELQRLAHDGPLAIRDRARAAYGAGG
jgi:hypothetical protein